MRVSVNGRAIGELDERVERALRLRRSHGPVEGITLSAERVVAAAGRDMKLLFGLVGGFAIVTMGMPIALTAVKAPSALPLVASITLGLAFFIAAALVVVYRLRLAGIRKRVAANLPGAPPLGTLIRVADKGLTIGGTTRTWDDLTIEAVDIRRTYNEATITTLDRLRLSGEGLDVLLDRELTLNGRLLVDQAWRYLRPAPAKR